MKACDMRPFVAYRAATDSPDKSISKGELMWLSDQDRLCLPRGVLESEEWRSPETVGFEVEEDRGYRVDRWNGNEGLRKRLVSDK